jgi:deoxyribose-phosphate aldolase
MCALNSKTITHQELAKTLDLSLVKPEMTETDIITGCERARSYHLVSVSVKPCYLKLAVKQLAGSDVAVGTVVGFPHGDSTSAIKVAETREAVANGAVELDMVINIGELRSGHTQYVKDEIQSVVGAAAGKAILKVILENVYLTREQIVQACRLAEAAGANFVKTSSGFSPRGATAEDVRLMRASVGPAVQVKAAGGVRSLDALLALIDAGATRVGASAAIPMLDEFKQRYSNR